MATTQQHERSYPKFSIRKDKGVYSGPLFAVSPGGVPTQEYPKFVETPDYQQENQNTQQNSPPVPNAPAVRYPVFNADTVESPPVPATSDPYNAQDAANQNFNELLTASPEDQNGRLKSSLYGLAAPVAPSDSLGRLIGERLANAANYALDPKLDEEAAQKEEIAKQLTIRKIQQDRDEAQAAINLKNAEAANQNSLPIYRTQQEQDKATRDAQTNNYHVISGLEREYRNTPVYDPTAQTEISNPNSLTNRAARAGVTFSAKNPRQGKGGMQVGDTRYEYDLNGDLQPATAGGKVLVDPTKTVGEDGLTNEQREKKNEAAAKLQSQERIAQWANANRSQIAATQAALRKEHDQHTVEKDATAQANWEASFRSKHPGYGLQVTHAQLAQKYQEWKAKNPQTRVTEDQYADKVREDGYSVVP